MVFVCFCGMTIAYPKTQHQQWFPGRGLQSENKTWIERYVDSDTHKYCVSLCVYHVCVYHVSSDLHKEQHNMQAESTQIHPQLNLHRPSQTSYCPRGHKLLGPLCSYPTYSQPSWHPKCSTFLSLNCCGGLDFILPREHFPWNTSGCSAFAAVCSCLWSP